MRVLLVGDDANDQNLLQRAPSYNALIVQVVYQRECFHFGGWVTRDDTFYDLKSGGLATIPISSWRIAREGLFF